MNREQSEHILEAYVRMRMRMHEGDEEATDALREVILDAMATERMVKEQVISTYPHITLPATGNPTYGNLNTVTCGTKEAGV